jgi:hypothetical protein
MLHVLRGHITEGGWDDIGNTMPTALAAILSWVDLRRQSR